MDSKLRKKIIKTKNGNLNTPVFLPDATRGYVKLLDNKEIKRAGVNSMVVNAFHLYLQPGMKLIKKAGGIHNFMNWQGPLLSDSGGFQVFSLIRQNNKKFALGKVSEKEVIFISPLDGARHKLTPEKSIQIQFDLGVDMMVCLDDCPPNDLEKEEMEKSVIRTIAWAKRCRKEYDKQIKKRRINEKERPLLFSVIQGGAYLDLRQDCAEELIKIGFDGYGFGARPVDRNGNFLEKVLSYTADLIPKNAWRFALGVGMPEDIVRCARMGWDIFDCVIPTREGRHGRLFYFKNHSLKGHFYYTINILNSKFKKDFSPINSESKIEQLKKYSKAYLYHLFKTNDPLGQRLASLNNLEFYSDLMNKL